MGREIKRVPLDFDWPVGKTWEGFINPLHTATKCEACDGSGSSPTMMRLRNLWYGYRPFRPEDRGSTPFLPDDADIIAFAQRNVERSPDHYGTGDFAIKREAQRLCRLINESWSHHLNDDDVKALLDAGRLIDFTSVFVAGTGWKKKEPPYIPTSREVNIWSCGGMAHDSINQWVVCKAECARLNEPIECHKCNGEGEHWPSPEAKKAYEDWQPTEPPTGDGWQVWETVSEGSPISPPFSTPEDLARHMATTKWGADKGTPYETWLKFIRGPGWAPSMIGMAGNVMDGVTGIVALETTSSKINT